MSGLNFIYVDSTARLRVLRTYRSFIGMDMASKYDIDLVLNKPGLELDSHGFPFHIVIVIAIVPWGMH